MTQQVDVAIVGGGIVGLAHAWMASARGLRVVVLERHSAARGASVRNFGMVWPIGQPPGMWRDVALQSRQMWLQLAEQAGVWCQPCGSLHVAHRADELAVLEEFVQRGRQPGMELQLLTAAETIRRTPAVKPQGLLGAMWSPSELGVNPPQAIAALASWLGEQPNVDCHFNAPIVAIDGRTLAASDGRRWTAQRVLVCSGHDFQTLLPETFAVQPLTICKLHMLKTVCQPGGWRIGSHLASGLTLRHYAAFADCPAQAALQHRVQQETPELNRYGIHVMASQNERGEVILGDSHEYDADISPFDRAEIDTLILRELRRQFEFPEWTLASRWHGYYAKHRQLPILQLEPQPNVHVCVAPGGAGMTLSLGIAARFWDSLVTLEQHR